ncbi:MAG: branched-chain amino acid ABC transporter permease, partial [Deltaproteobacteria bacterium]|nr:branched-chain amino acid ABC transporter permease [Deltaproteobacteria bacterium]
MNSEIRKSIIAAAWFSLLSFPLIVLKVDYIEKTIDLRWNNLIFIAVGTFFVSYVWRYFLRRGEK